MKTIIKIIFVLVLFTGATQAQNYWLLKTGNVLTPIVPGWKIPDTCIVVIGSGTFVLVSDTTGKDAGSHPTLTMWGTLGTEAKTDSAVQAYKMAKAAKDTLTANSAKTNPSLGKEAVWDAPDSLGNVAPKYIEQIDSTLIIANEVFYIAGPTERALKIDSIFTIGIGAAINVVVTYYYNDTLNVVGTSIITSPAATTSLTVGAWQSTINNAVVPAGNFIWAKITTMTTAGNKLIIKIRYHYGST